MMGTAWAISEVLKFPIFCKECEAIGTKNKQILPASEVKSEGNK